jgi:hypothetical protein
MGEQRWGGGHNPPGVSRKLKYKMKKWIGRRNSNGAVVVVSVVIVIVTDLSM